MDIDFNIENKYSAAELLPYERKKLFGWIKELIKPQANILEIGTGTGGSTYYLSKGLESLNQNGKIYTCDPERRPTSEFMKDCTNVIFYPIPSRKLINFIIENKIDISYIFFDGPEDPDIAMDDINILENYITNTCYFSMHDWEISTRKYDNAISTKAAYIRPYMESSNKWQKIEVLDGINSCESVGLCLYKYIN